jgi:hypothetical protein
MGSNDVKDCEKTATMLNATTARFRNNPILLSIDEELKVSVATC